MIPFKHIFIRFFLIILQAAAFTGRAAFDPVIAGGSGNGAGMTSVTLQGDVFSTAVNPALLGTHASLRAGSTHTRLFGLKALSRTAAGICLPVRFGSLGAGGVLFGNPLYQETIVHLGWGIPLDDRFCLGFGFSSGQFRIKTGPSLSAMWFDTGLHYRISEAVHIGFSLSNWSNRRLNGTEPLPQITRFGFEIHPAGGVRCIIEFDKDVRFPLEIRSGIEICPVPGLIFRCGMTDTPHCFTAGFGIHMKKLSVDYAVIFHPVLGMTHHTSLSFCLQPVRRDTLFPSEP